jgi:hypothetical protein
MNRKLHHSLIAMSATAAVLGVLLLAAGPLQSPVSQPTLSMNLPIMASLPISTALALEDTVQLASQRRHLRHSRALLAMPYFSFAQGLRRNRS